MYVMLCLDDLFVCLSLVFFFKQKTAYEMRISDWSSDVCSSDLHDSIGRAVQAVDALDRQRFGADAVDMCAHRDEAIAKIDDFGFARGVFEDASPLGQHRRHQRILGRTDRDDGKGEFAAG